MYGFCRRDLQLWRDVVVEEVTGCVSAVTVGKKLYVFLRETKEIHDPVKFS